MFGEYRRDDFRVFGCGLILDELWTSKIEWANSPACTRCRSAQQTAEKRRTCAVSADIVTTLSQAGANRLG